jgi:hypothetical protein
MGVLRTDREPGADFAEWWAARECGLQLVSNTVNKGYDAFDEEGRTYQVKSRRVKNVNEPTSFDFKDVGEFDFLVIVFLVRNCCRPLSLYRLPRRYVLDHLSKNRRFRWHRMVRDEVERLGYQPVFPNLERQK